MIKIAIFLLVVVVGLEAKCPTENELGNDVCCILYKGGDPDPDQSCSGDSLKLMCGDEPTVLPAGWNDAASSLVSAPHTLLKAFDAEGHTGATTYFPKGIKYLKSFRRYSKIPGKTWDRAISSLICTCYRTPI